MANINDLNQDSTLSAGDLLPLWSSANGATYKASLTTLAAFLATLSTSSDSKVTQFSAPLTGANIQVQGINASDSVWFLIIPAGTIAALTVTLPAQASCIDRQEVLITTTQTITSLIIAGNGSTVVGAVTTLAANASTKLRFEGATKIWYKVQ